MINYTLIAGHRVSSAYVDAYRIQEVLAGKWQLTREALERPEGGGWAAAATAVAGSAAWWDDGVLVCAGASGAVALLPVPSVAGQANSYAPGMSLSSTMSSRLYCQRQGAGRCRRFRGGGSHFRAFRGRAGEQLRPRSIYSGF